MKKNAIIAAIASLALVFGVTGTAVMLNGDKAITETSTSVVEGDSSTDNQSGNTDKAGDEKSESDSGEVSKSEDTADKDEDREDADTTEKDSAPTTNKNSGKSGVTTAASTPAPAESDAGSAQISGGTDSKVTTPHTDSSEQNQSSSEDTAQNPDGGSDSGSDGGSDGEEDKTPHTDISPADVVRLTNDERVKNGLEVLETETAIQDAANIRAKENATNFSHTRPDGTSFSTAISGKYSHTGENIAYSTGNVTAEKFVSMWMASSGHKANILGDYTGIAVGIYYDENSDTTYAVQLFVSDEEDSQYTYTDTVVPPTCTEQGYTLHTCNEDASKSYKDNYIDALGHDYGDGVVTTPATCTESGVKTYTCSRCGDTTTEIINATGHQTEVQNAKEATCAEDGYTGDTVCTVCGETVAKGEVIKATGHQTEVQNAKEATCTENGYTGDTVCTVCGETVAKGEVIKATGHQTEVQNAKEATCTENGYTGDTVCTVCGETVAKGEVIKATGHKTEVQNAKAATCTEDGYTGDTVCTVCGETVAKGEVIKATGHNFVDGSCTICGEEDPDYNPEPEYTYTDTVVPPTCTEKGYTLHTCNEDASKSYKDNYIDALGHDYGDGVVTTPATCTENGVKTYTCSRCGDTTTEIISATGHKTEVQNAKPATCTEDGYTGDTVCTVCGETVAKGEIIKATGHNFVDGSCTICGAEDPDYNPEPEYTYTVSVVEPTCTEQGYTLHTCNEDASKTYKDNYTAALGHDWDGANLGATCRRCGTPLFVFDHTVDATCQDGGYDVYVSVADPSQTRMTNFTDPIDHIYENGFCIMCGEEEPDIPNYDDNYDKNYYNNTIISLTNQARENRGLSSLRYASEYQAAADIRAQEIVSNFSHTRPNGSGPETTLDELGCEYSSVGENIAYVASMYKPNKIVENWLASPGHASNMLSSTFDSFVVGTACSDGRVYAVQLFFTDASADANSVQTMTLDEAEAVDEEAPAASESAEDIVPAPTEEPIELPEETTAPDEELEETTEETPSPVETPAPEVTPSPVETPAPEVTPSPEPSTEPTPAPTPEAPTVTEEPAVPEEVAPIETPAPEATPEPTEEPADAAPEESPIQEQDVITPPEETELVVPQMEEIPDDTPADAAE